MADGLSPAAVRALRSLGPEGLHHLAAAAEMERHRRRWAPIADPEQAAVELAELLAAGELPTVGWWRAHRRMPLRALGPLGEQEPAAA